jgi:DNA-directed RNA polymerase specialized sigma24 family protein
VKNRAKENKLSYEDCYEIIDGVVQKFQKKWQLKAVNWFDFEDVSQTIKLHIFNKWHMWDQTLPLEPWIARITSNQLKNIIRNNYTNYVKPCMQCQYNMGDNLCSWTKNGVQNSSCKLYAKWAKQKQAGYGIKMPLPMENHLQEVNMRQDFSIDFETPIEKINELLRQHLSETHYKVYIMLFFEHQSEEEVAKFMGYKTTEKNRKAGYKQIKNLKRMLKEKVEYIIREYDIIL